MTLISSIDRLGALFGLGGGHLSGVTGIGHVYTRFLEGGVIRSGIDRGGPSRDRPLHHL